MKKKYAISLAQVLADHREAIPPQTFEQLLCDIAEVCAASNPAFSHDQFFAAARAIPFVKRKK
jgi:hypothetical protein